MRLFATSGAVFICCLSTQALADSKLLKTDNIEIRLQLGGGVYYENQSNPGFGSGVESERNGSRRVTDNNQSLETYVYGGLSFVADTQAGKFFAVANAIGTLTGLDGDSSGISSAGTKRIALEEAYFGWTSGKLLPGLPDDALSISVGPQSFQLNDGFVIWDGNDDNSRDGVSSLSVRSAFPMAAVAQFDGSFFHLDAFWLKADPDQSSSKLYGGQFSAIWPEVAEGGVTYFKIYDSNNALGTARKGMNVLNFYGAVHAELPFIQAEFKAGYTQEFGTVEIENEPVPTIEYDANAYYFLADASLSNVPATPSIRYRYASYSGDRPDTILTVEEYDPLFIDPIEYGSIGFFSGSNASRHEFEFSLKPMTGLKLKTNFVSSKLNRPVYRGRTLSSRGFSKLYGIGAEYELKRDTKFFLNFSIEKPDAAARQYFGNNKDIISTSAVLLVDW